MEGLLTRKKPLAEAVGSEEPQAEAAQMQDADSRLLAEHAEEASEEEQAEYQGAVQAAVEIVYTNDSSHQSVLKSLQANTTPVEKGLVETTMLVLTEIDKQLDLSGDVLLEVAKDILDMMIELSEKALKIPVDERQQKRALSGVTMKVIDEYGIDEEEGMNEVMSLDDEKAEAMAKAVGDFTK